MEYIVMKTDSERNTEVIGTADTKEKAQEILKNDFEKSFKKKYQNDEDFIEICADFATQMSEDGEFEDGECGLAEESAYMDNCDGSDFDWRVLNTTCENILTEPLSMRDIILQTTEDNTYVEGNVVIDVDDMIGHNLDEFLDILEYKLVGNNVLMDIDYTPVDITNRMIIIHVSGDAVTILDNVEFSDIMYEELKKAVFDAGADAVEDLIGHPLTFANDDEMSEAMDDALDQMPDEEQIEFYRKYVSAKNEA